MTFTFIPSLNRIIYKKQVDKNIHTCACTETHTHTLITRHVLFKETQVQVSICCESDGSGPTCCLLITHFPHLHLFSLTSSQPLSSTADSQSSNPPHATTNPNPYYSSHLFSPTFRLLFFYVFLEFLKKFTEKALETSLHRPFSSDPS